METLLNTHPWAEGNPVRTSLSDQDDLGDALRFSEGLIWATFLSITLWTAIVWISLSV